MQKSQIQKSNINKTINKVIIASIIICVSMIAIMVGVNYINQSNFNLSKIGHNINLMLFSTISAFILNMILMYQTVKDIKRDKHIIINPAYATIATVFLNILFVATITTMSTFLNQNQSLIENITNNIITAIAITFFTIFGLIIYNNLTVINISIMTLILISINLIMGNIMTYQRFDAINHLADSQKYTASNITMPIFSALYFTASVLVSFIIIVGIFLIMIEANKENTK